MSVQFGQWSFPGLKLSPQYLARIRELLLPYGPDGETSFSSGGVNLFHFAFHTTKESRSERQPYASSSGVVITWDGRLDNRAELIRQFTGLASTDSTDVELICRAYERWGTDCFPKLVGDWAVAIWDPNDRLLVLAKDPLGTRHLNYSSTKNQVSWCTVLDPLVLGEGRTFELNEEYLAGWLSFFPAPWLTPYRGVESVPPSCFVRLSPGRQSIHKYWDFHPSRRISYRNDTEYEEHFRVAFAQAVQRRLRSDAPILAELSGGMDSSSIVCVADGIISRGAAQTPRLDTVSYYNDSEPNWNERPYFTAVEKRRGCVGHHIDVEAHDAFRFDVQVGRFLATPACLSSTTERAKRFSSCITSHGCRVLLSGIGGDEVLGGVPTPIPELKDLLVQLRFRSLAHKLKVWALEKRKPWFHLFFEAIGGFFPLIFGVSKPPRPPDWLDGSFVRRNRDALEGYKRRTKLLGPLPSFQDNLGTLDALRRQLGLFALTPSNVYETRYPYLDRDLLEFLYAIPRDQLVRPGQRRSLMRRALVGIVPNEVLERKRKAFVSRTPFKKLIEQETNFVTLFEESSPLFSRIVNIAFFSQTFDMARNGHDISVPSILRALTLQAWLHALERQGVWEERSDLKQFSPQEKGGEHHEIREAHT